MARIAMDLSTHRDMSTRSTSSYMNREQVNMLYRALSTLARSEYDFDTLDDEHLDLNKTLTFFTPEEMAWIRKHSKTEAWRLNMMDVAPQVAGGFLKGLMEGIKAFAGDVVK